MPTVCKHGIRSSQGVKSPVKASRVARPGEVELGWWAAGVGAGASLHRCAAPSSRGNTAQQEQLPHEEQGLPGSGNSEGTNCTPYFSQESADRSLSMTFTLQLLSVRHTTGYACLVLFLLENKSRCNECSAQESRRSYLCRSCSVSPGVISFSSLCLFSLGAKRRIQTASEDCFSVVGSGDIRDAAGDCTASARLENALHG